MDLGGYEIAIGVLFVVGSLVVGPFLKRISRHPARSQLSDYYQAVPIAFSSLLAEGNFVVDLLNRMVREPSQAARASLADRCYITFALVPFSFVALVALVRVQRGVDPKGDARGWKPWLFMIVSNGLAVALLYRLLVFIKKT